MGLHSSAGRAPQHANAEATGSNSIEAPNFFGVFCNCLNCDSLQWSHIHFICIFQQFTKFHSVFHSFHGLMNSINWPVSSVWVSIAQLVEYCSANAEATGSSRVEDSKKHFSGYVAIKLRFTAIVTYSFHSYLSETHFQVSKTLTFTLWYAGIPCPANTSQLGVSK